jgi:hypothetical protein
LGAPTYRTRGERSRSRSSKWGMMKPGKADRGVRRAGDRVARREASVYVRTVLETVRDVSYVSPDVLHEPARVRRRSSGGAERLRLRWLETQLSERRS